MVNREAVFLKKEKQLYVEGSDDKKFTTANGSDD